MSDQEDKYQFHHCEECNKTHIILSLTVEEAISIRPVLEEDRKAKMEMRSAKELTEEDIDDIDYHVQHVDSALNQIPPVDQLEEIEEDEFDDEDYGVQ